MTMDPAAPTPPAGDPKPRHFVWRWIRLITGWTLLVLGVAGLFLPFLQGILFIASGLALLSAEYHWARRILARFAELRKRRSAARGAVPTPPNRSDSPPNTPI